MEVKEKKVAVFSSLSDRLELSFKNSKKEEKSLIICEVNGEQSIKNDEPIAEKADEAIVKLPEKSESKSPERVQMKSPQKSESKSPQKLNKSPEKLKIEMKIERKKSPKRMERPKVNIFLQDSDEVDEFESIPLEIKSKWSSPRPILLDENKFPQIVPAPLPSVDLKKSIIDVPVVIESPEKSPVTTVPFAESIFESSMIIQKSPTPSPPPQPTKVRNVCSFLSDIASGSMFSGHGLGSGMFDDDEKSIGGLNLDNYKANTSVKLPEERRKIECLKLDIECIMEPDTTVDKIAEKLNAKSTSDSDSDSDSDDSDSDTSSSSDSDDTTSESEESSDSSSDDDVPTFAGGFGRFDASSMPMVTQIKPTTTPVTPTTSTVSVASRFQPQQSYIKPPGLLTNVTKPTFYTPQTLSGIPAVTTPFTIPLPGQMPLIPIPYKIYSLRDATNCQITFPAAAQPVPATPTVEQADKEKDKKSSERDRRDKDRKRSRSHSRDRDKKRDDRRKSSPRRRSSSPAKKRHDERGRQLDERKDSRRREPSPRHGSHSSRTSHGSR